MAKQPKNELMGYDLDDTSQKEELAAKLMEQVRQGIPLKIALGISDEDMEHVYSLAYSKYQTGSYQEATHLFRYLVSVDPEKYKFTLGLAASHHRLHEYQQAANLYVLATIRNSKDPVPYFHAADCYLHLKEDSLAESALELCIAQCAEEKQFSTMKERAQLMLSAIRDRKGESQAQQSTDSPKEKTAKPKTKTKQKNKNPVNRKP